MAGPTSRGPGGVVRPPPVGANRVGAAGGGAATGAGREDGGGDARGKGAGMTDRGLVVSYDPETGSGLILRIRDGAELWFHRSCLEPEDAAVAALMSLDILEAGPYPWTTDGLRTLRASIRPTQ